MDRNSDSSTDEPRAAEKKMKVDTTTTEDENETSETTTTTIEDAEMTSVEVVESTTTDISNSDSNSNGAESHKDNKTQNQQSTLFLSSVSDNTVSSNTDTTDGVVNKSSSSPAPSTEIDSTTPCEAQVVVVPEPDIPVEQEEDFGEPIDLKVVFNKLPLKIKMPLKKTIGDLKLLIEKETQVAPALQKVVLKGLPKDDATLESLSVTTLTKIMVIGTSLGDVMAMASKPPDKDTLVADDLSSSSKKDATNWCSLAQHKKIIDKGVPDDAMPGILNESEQLPDIPLFGMLNSKGKVRLTFKLELDELWIGTKERTDKVPIGSIRHVESQPITGYEHYHILAIQMGPTEASRYFVYWVPAQYVIEIKNALSN